jgi:hypothetical protein
MDRSSVHTGDMHRFTSVLALLALACTPSEDSERPEAAASEANASEPLAIEAEPTPVDAIEGDEWFLGFVSQTGIEHCATEFEPEWLAVRSTLGFIPTSGASLDAWMAKPVLARGRTITTPERGLEVEPKPCPIAQMRGDWVGSPLGTRIDRRNHPEIEHFLVTSAEPLASLKVTRVANELTVDFQNPLPFALAEFAILVHYEGCHGKPGATHRWVASKPLAVGEARIERFDIVVDELPPPGERKGGPTAREHLAYSIELSAIAVADAPTLHVDLDVPLAALGIDVDCPPNIK